MNIGKQGQKPPKLPPRNAPLGANSDPYDSLRGSNPALNRSSGTPPIRSPIDLIKPYLPKIKKSPSHESSFSSYDTRPPLPPPPSASSMAPPPIPDKPPNSKPGSTTPTMKKRSPAKVPPTRRVQSFAGPHSLNGGLKPIITQNKPPPDDSDSSDDEYDMVDFRDEEYITTSEGDGYSFLRFIETMQNQFPIAFEVVLGYSSICEEVSISEGERFIAHFLKRAKMFTIETESKDQYMIPLNTSFQFAILHNPNNNTKEALSGFIFKTAGDIMLSKVLPKVIRAKKSFRGAGPDSCVSANELLFVKEVVSREGERRFVKCVQVASGNEKYLHEDCHGEFTTAPHEVRVYLPNIITHFQLPLETLMCMGPDNEEDIPSHLVSTVATILSAYTEESLIASSIMDDRNDEGTDFTIPDDVESIVLNDIPLNFDINVNLLPVSPAKAEQILKITDKLYAEFDPINVFPYLAKYSREQLSLIKSIQKDNNKKGITLVESKAIKKCREAAAALASSTPTVIGGGSFNTAGIEKRLDELESQNLMYQKAFENISGRTFNVITNVTGGGGVMSIASLHTEFVHMKQEMEELKKTVTKLSNAINSIEEGRKREYQQQQQPSYTNNASTKAENRQFLSTLEVNELCEVLIAMNLGEHTPKFRSEMVTGALLSELTEDIIQHELGVDRVIQRKKLLKLISGEYSAEQYLLEGEDDSYIKMTKS